MANREFRERLARRARAAGVSLDAVLVQGLETYYQLLAKWNAKINLTAFRLTPDGDDQAIDRLLIDMPPTDPVTFAGAALLLTMTTLMACYLPARRATRVDPILTLRHE